MTIQTAIATTDNSDQAAALIRPMLDADELKNFNVIAECQDLPSAINWISRARVAQFERETADEDASDASEPGGWQQWIRGLEISDGLHA